MYPHLTVTTFYKLLKRKNVTQIKKHKNVFTSLCVVAQHHYDSNTIMP